MSDAGNSPASVGSQPSAQEELVITRAFDAPRELVWNAWTDAAALAQWWGPKGFKMGIAKLDFKPGGIFHYSMQPPNGGNSIWGKFTYQEIMRPELIVFVNCFSDEHAGVTRNPWNPIWPLEVHNTLSFTESRGKTTLTLRGNPIHASQAEMDTFVKNRPGMQQGFNGTFDQLDEFLAKARI